MKKLYVALITTIQALIIGGVFATITFADTSGASKLNSGSVVFKYENDLIVAEIDQAPLSDVIKKIEATTGARLILKDSSIVNYPLSVNIREARLEDALKRIFKNYSYATYFDSGGKVNKVMIFGAKAGAPKGPAKHAVDSQSSLSTSGSAYSASAEESIQKPVSKGEISQSEAASQQTSDKEKSDAEQEESPDELSPDTADVPYDLDDYLPLPEDLPDEGDSYLGSEEEQGPEAGRLAAEQHAAREERLEQARLERSLSALNSKHAHLRSMALEELVRLKDPRVTTALANVAGSDDVPADEKRQAAQALWHHAADYQFADSTANEALERLAGDSDPAVRATANRALNDMKRYQKRNQRR